MSTGIMTRERFASLLEPYIFKVYENVIEKGDDIIPRLFSVETTNQSKEVVTGIGAMGLMQPWKGTVHYDSPEALWDKTYTVKKYSTGIKIDRDLWDDALYAEAKNRVQRAILAVHRTRQLHATSVFDNAFTAGAYAGPDGVALCSATHDLSPTQTSSHQVNAGSSTFSKAAIEATRIAMMNFTDDRGQKLLIVPDTIIIPPNLEEQALEYNNSVGRSDTANRADNVRKGAYNILTLPLLSDSNNWFMIDSQLAKQYLMWFERRKPIPEQEADFDTEVLKWKLVSRYVYGFHGWQWIYGHAVS